MLFKNIGLVNEYFEFEANMYVGVEGRTITYVSNKEPKDRSKYGEIYDGSRKVLMPGFYNAHGHSTMTLMRGYGEGLPLYRWLNELVFPFEDQLYTEGVYWGTLLSLAESIRFGIVSTSEMYFHLDGMFKAIVEGGTKSNLSRSISHMDGCKIEDSLGYREMLEAIKTFNGYDNGRVIVDASPHAEYTNDEAMIVAIADVARKYNLRNQVHVSETASEVAECIERHGKTPIEFMESCGLLDQPTTLAHCVHINDKDIEIIKKHNSTVASTPLSNLKLASGICQVKKLYDTDINVAIGTDSVTSNNSLNFFEEMKMFSLLGKVVSNDASVISPQQALYSATRAGALSQGRFDCGLIKEGYKADLIAIDASQPNMNPVFNMINNLVYSADGKDVILTMVDGKVLYQDGEYKTIDVEKAIAETDIARLKMLDGVRANQEK